MERVALSAPAGWPTVSRANAVDQGRGRPRHLVLLRAVAVLDIGLARQDAGAETLLPHQHPRHRLRHHLLLGRAHDDDGHALYEGGAVPHRLHPRHRSRRDRREDVETEGQRRRPLRLIDEYGADACASRSPPWPRRAATSALPAARRGLSQLRHQAVERGALCRDERVRAPEGLRPQGRRGDAQPLDRRRGASARPPP